MIAHDPLHGSGRAALPHPALALGDDAHTAQGIGMTDDRQRQPAVDEAPHAIPTDAAVLTAPRQRAMPEPSHLEPKDPQRVLVPGHAVIPNVPPHHRLQPFALVGDGFVHTSLKFGFHLVQLRLQSLAYRLPQHRKPSIAPLLYADMRKAEEVGVERVQRLMLAAPWSEPVRKIEKVSFVDGIQHLDRRALDDFVFQRRDPERSLPPVGLGDVHSTHRLRSVRSSLQPFGKILEIPLQFLAVVPPRLPIHAWRGFLLQSEVGHAQCFRVVDVVQERREPQLLILSCCLTYPLQRTRRVVPARCPGRVLLWQVSFGQTASLRPFRNRLPGFVQGLLRFYRAVRLPKSVRHRRTSLDFPMRPTATAALGRPGISRFPREVSPYVLGVSDRAGLWCTSRYRCIRWGLPLSPTASASRRKVLTRLNTRPSRSPVNASTPPLRAAPHDSGPMWVATSHSYDFCIHYTSP